MAVATRQVTVGTTAVRLVDTRTLGGGSEVLIKNLDATELVYIGISTVSHTTGYPLAAGESIPIVMAGIDDVYARVQTTSVVVAVLRTGT